LKIRISSILQYIAGLSLGLFLLWWAFQETSWEELKQSIQKANLSWLAIAMGVGLCSHFFRGLRWRMQLKATGYNVSILNTFAATMSTYAANTLVPRAGEVARCTLLLKSDRVPLAVSLGTVVTERLIDLLILLTLIGSAFLLEFERIQTFIAQRSAEQTGNESPSILLYLIGAGIIIALVLFLLRGRLLANPRIKALFEKVKQLATELIKAAISIKDLERPLLFIFFTLAIWFCYWLMTYLAFFSIGEMQDINISLAYFGFIVFIMGGIGMAIPSPGGVGSYHGAVIFTFVAFSVAGSPEASKELGQVFAFLMHTSQILMITSVGALGACYLLLVPPKDARISSQETRVQES